MKARPTNAKTFLASFRPEKSPVTNVTTSSWSDTPELDEEDWSQDQTESGTDFIPVEE